MSLPGIDFLFLLWHNITIIIIAIIITKPPSITIDPILALQLSSQIKYVTGVYVAHSRSLIIFCRVYTIDSSFLMYILSAAFASNSFSICKYRIISVVIQYLQRLRGSASFFFLSLISCGYKIFFKVHKVVIIPTLLFGCETYIQTTYKDFGEIPIAFSLSLYVTYTMD